MPDNLKKTLIVSTYAPPSIGGPQMLYNLLCQFPKDSYAVLTSFYAIDNLSATKGTWLAGDYIFYDNLRATKETRVQAVSKEDAKNKWGGRIQRLKLLMKRSKIMYFLAGFPVIIYQIITIVRAGKKALTEQDTDLMLGISDYGPAMIGTYCLHKLTKKPYYLFMFDIYKGNFFPFPGGLLARIFEKRILANASKVIVNNQGTKNFYHDRYGEDISKNIELIYNSVFPEDYAKLEPKKKRSAQEPFVLLFTGRINWPQLGALKNVIQAVDELRDMNVQFQIYTPMPREHLRKIGVNESPKVMISFAAPEEIPKIQNGADALFIPLSWHTKSPGIIATATPGKLTDYLIAGKPMLVHAPAYSYLIQYAKENNFGLAIDEENIEKLKEGIKKLVSDPAYGETLVKNAKATFFKNHDANTNGPKFQKLFLKN